ncbi:hypothetical protein ABTQ33_07605 [Paucilactobacillus suebicus]|uniref:Transposase n=1 Tax=Paucilactobacillus suebicus DSM 5007 = KCTC 3549 TaxID=1423807 RepID=A0A0R1VWX4_9LACO|nr:hypothetical protein [Paucilactobacillus suebicus]KRM10200.1 hypothetical protein FD16_GL001471 [Paucilactobacillus suebicus DSM 5007 = KCTC 3549]
MKHGHKRSAIKKKKRRTEDVICLTREVEEQYGSVANAPDDDPRFVEIRRELAENSSLEVDGELRHKALTPRQKDLIVGYCRKANEKWTMAQTLEHIKADNKVGRLVSDGTLRHYMHDLDGHFLKKHKGAIKDAR